jgi:hemoglobin
MYNLKTFKSAWLLLVALGAGTACAHEDHSLYDRLGGKPAIETVINEFVSIVGADQRVNHFFAKTDLVHFKAMMVDQVCEASGGPCKYTGRDMPTTHRGMGVTDADFAAVVEDLVKALDKLQVPKREQDDLLALLGPMKDQIVGQ